MPCLLLITNNMSFPFKSDKTLFKFLTPERKTSLFVSTKSSAILLFVNKANNGTAETSPKSIVSLSEFELMNFVKSLPLSKPVNPIFSKNKTSDVKFHIKINSKIADIKIFHFPLNLRILKIFIIE